MLLLMLLISAGSATPQPAREMPMMNPVPQARTCPETPMSLARKLGRRGAKAIPLDSLPPAKTFMAVDRRVNGCPAPLTMTDYRAGRRR